MIELNPEIIVKYLLKASEAYYNGEPIITDNEFDRLRDKLEEMDPDNTFLKKVGAPKPKSGWPTHKHRTLMGSLDKVKNRKDFMKWAEEKGEDFVLSEKFDGSTVVATYKNGKLISLATRGDGFKGENITPNAKEIKNVPADLNYDFTGEIRGEAILKISLFEKYFRPVGYSNPRNAANGKIRDMKKDPLKQHIEVKWFDIIPIDRDIQFEFDKWELIASLGLKVNSSDLVIGTAEDCWIAFEGYLNGKRAKLDYEIDGLVIKVNNIDMQESFGVRSNKPKGAIAIKFPSQTKETIIKDITWNRGLTGVFCPTAHFKPVEIGGVIISKASLCGFEEIKRLNINVGDTVIISRRNDVIPKVERVISRAVGRPNHMPPTHCDQCFEELTRDGAYILCLNEQCQGEIYGNLMTWIKEFKIKGFGPSMIRALILEEVTNISKLYTASRAVFHRAAGSKKNGDKRYDTLHEFGTKNAVKLSTFLSALNIKALGSTNGQRLEKEFKTLDNILNATVEDLQRIHGIKTNARKIHAGLQKNKVLINELRGLITIKNLDESGPLAGKSFCITGDLSIPRSKIQEWIKEQGGEIKTGVSKTLSYLITNDPDSGTGKNKKANKYGIPKLTEDKLYELAKCKPVNYT